HCAGGADRLAELPHRARRIVFEVRVEERKIPEPCKDGDPQRGRCKARSGAAERGVDRCRAQAAGNREDVQEDRYLGVKTFAPISGWSMKNPSIPRARKRFSSPARSPGAGASLPERNSAGRKVFSTRKVQPWTTRPAACASATSVAG